MKQFKGDVNHGRMLTGASLRVKANNLLNIPLKISI
jgi:hypothetical protein